MVKIWLETEKYETWLIFKQEAQQRAKYISIDQSQPLELSNFLGKYLMKNEKSSNSHTKAAKAVIDNLNPVTETRKALQKVLMNSNIRDRSKQVCFL